MKCSLGNHRNRPAGKLYNPTATGLPRETVLGSLEGGASPRALTRPPRGLLVMFLTSWMAPPRSRPSGDSGWGRTGRKGQQCLLRAHPKLGFLRTDVAKQSDCFICRGGRGRSHGNKNADSLKEESSVLRGALSLLFKYPLSPTSYPSLPSQDSR